ncbi:dihydropteroate synthase [candidate division KSB1 bacterium]|nr:dihydropteroate synthase [candidate division KSB1 bacterium]
MKSTHPLIWQCRDITLPIHKTLVMGIVNVTPDSFSDGGRFYAAEAAIDHALLLAYDGADILDLGAESSRPGADPVSEQEELSRLIPVVEELIGRVNIPISVDTYKASVADEMLKRDVHIINDISGLHYDPAMKDVVAKYQAGLVVMHIKGTPKNMQANPLYDDVVTEVRDYLKQSIAMAETAGLPRSHVVIDPGIGFGKRLVDNYDILRRLDELSTLDCPILIGPSRKSFIGSVLNVPPEQRLEGTAAAVAIGIANGADIVRVHDVREMKRVCRISDLIVGKETL